jgi:gluconate kinase
VRKLSIGRWPTPPLNAAGYKTYFRNFMFMSRRLLPSIMTTYHLSQNQFIIDERALELDIHFVRKKVALGQFRVLQIPTRHQLADIMTKGMPTPLFTEFKSSLCIRPTDAQTAEGVNMHV